MPDFFRTGTPIAERPDRYRAAIETPDPPGHRGLLPGGPRGAAPARRGPVARRPRRRRPLRRRPLARRHGPPLPGARARRGRVRGRFGRPGAGRPWPRRAWRTGSRSARPRPPSPARSATTTWPTSSTRSTSCTTPRRCSRAAWAALRPGGRLLVLDWPLPSSPEEFRTRHGEIIAGVQLDELYQGTALATRERFLCLVRGGRPAGADVDRPAVGRGAVRRGAAGLTLAP